MTDPNRLPRVSFIVAQAENRAIGKDNDLLWHLSGDLKRFKSITMGHTVVMGRRTWESLPKKPLAGRRNIVLTHDASFSAEGAEKANSINALIEMLKKSSREETEDEVFVIGGASLYESLLPFADRLYVTWVHRDFEADVFFPVIDRSEFALSEESERLVDEKNGLTYSYAQYDRLPESKLKQR